MTLADLARPTGRGLVLLADEAYGRVRDMIRANAFMPHHVFREVELARTLDMSRTPVREALLRLRAEGVLGSGPRGGYVLVEIDEQALRNAYAVRGALDALAARSAAQRLTRMDAAQLQELYEAMESAVTSHDAKLLASLNTQFHDTIAKASGNAYLHLSLVNIRDVVERYRTTALADPERRREAHEEHGRLLDALLAKDGETAARFAEQHAHNALNARLMHFNSLAKQQG